MKDAKTFGVTWLGDGSTIKQMPLLNMRALCGEEPPVVISIFDFSDHMSEWGEKDAEYIGQLFKNKVSEFDPLSAWTNTVFFDGASNVQNAGEILCATYSQEFCFHGEKHGLSLFFGDLANFRPVKVSVLFVSLKFFAQVSICIRILSLKHADCIMCLGMVKVTGLMHNLCHKNLHWTMERGLVYYAVLEPGL